MTTQLPSAYWDDAASWPAVHELAAVVLAGTAGTVPHASDATRRFNGRPGAQVVGSTAALPETSFEVPVIAQEEAHINSV